MHGPRTATAAKWLNVVFLLAFAASLHSAPPLPNEANLIPNLGKENLPALRQGDRDVCSLFAMTGLAEVESNRRTAGPHHRLSEEYLIWAARKFSGNASGQAMFYEAVDGLNAYGICTDERMPYAPKNDPNRQPSAEAIAEARELRECWHGHWIKRWSVDAPLNDRQLQEIKRALAGGHPVACGLRWPNELKGSDLLDVPRPNQVFDGHSVMLVGYQDNPAGNGGGILRFRNSFGPQWGEQGYGTLSYAYAKAYANDALWLSLEPPQSEQPVVRYEAETLPVTTKGRCQTSSQKMSDFGARLWSGDAQLFCAAEKGGFVEVDFEVRAAGRYRLRVLATCAPDFGEVRAALDGGPLPPTFDLYAGRVCPSGSLELGTFDFTAGRHHLRFTAVGKNPVSHGFSFGLDTVDLLTAK